MFTIKNGDRPNAMNILVIVTDGGSVNAAQTSIQAGQLRRQGVLMLVIGVGTWMNSYELFHLASFPKSLHVTTVNSYNQLSLSTPYYINILCSCKYIHLNTYFYYVG